MCSAPVAGPPDAGSADVWQPLAERVACQAQDFVDGVGAVAKGEGGDETVPLLLLEVSQILLAGAQLGASRDIILQGNWEPPVGGDPDVNDPDLDALRQSLATHFAPIDSYVEVFDPYDTEAQVTAF